MLAMTTELPGTSLNTLSQPLPISTSERVITEQERARESTNVCLIYRVSIRPQAPAGMLKHLSYAL